MSDKKFWSNEPVIKEWNKDDADDMEPLVEFKMDETKQNSYTLPNNMEWYSIDPLKDKDWNDLTEFIKENYSAESKEWIMFHSKEFLKRALMLPVKTFNNEYLITIKYKNNIIGFIAGTCSNVKLTTSTDKNENTFVETKEVEKEIIQVDFLCVHKKWRSKRMAPVLIWELTRRAIKKGVFQAVYTSMNELSLPISKSNFYLKYLDVKKLVQSEFLKLNNDKEIEELKLKFSTKNVPVLNWKKCEESDILSLKIGFEKNYKDMKIQQIWNDDLLKYWFTNQDKTIHSFVLKNEKNEITDFISFFSTNYRKVNGNNLVPVAYIFHHFGETLNIENRLNQISYLAKKTGHNLLVSWAIAGASRNDYLSNRFMETPQSLNFFMYNWKMKPFPSSQVAMILF